MRRTPLLPSLVLAAGLLVATSCAGEDSGVSVAPAVPDTPEVTAPPRTTVGSGPDTTAAPETVAPSSGREILAAVGPSMAFVETPWSTGSGMLVADRFVLTNFHVVEPFGTASVTVGGTERFEDVPVAGVDVARDLALLGPLDVDAPSLTPEAPTGLAAGDELFLVGYPGELAVTPEPTISRGILSRIREESRWGLTYLQTDAAIAGGQSGGALVDADGRVVGLSGLSFGDGNFALALAGDELADAVEELAGGGGDRYRAIPETPSETSGTIELTGSEGEQVAVLRNEGEELTWTLRLDPAAAPRLSALDDFGNLLFVNQAGLEAAAAESGTTVEELLPELGFDPSTNREVAPGVYEVVVPAGATVVLFVGTASPTPVAMAWESSAPLFVPPDDDEGTTVEVGGSAEGIVEYVETYDTVTVDLVAGEAVEIAVRSPLGDPAFQVAGPGQPIDDGEFVDDSDEGLYGLDAVSVFTPSTTGPHRIRISSSDGYTMFWRLTVDPA